jgi:hypothetical protein
VNVQAFPAKIVNGSFRLMTFFIEYISDDDFGTLLGEQSGFGRAHTSGAPTDESNFVVQPHKYSLTIDFITQTAGKILTVGRS